MKRFFALLLAVLLSCGVVALAEETPPEALDEEIITLTQVGVTYNKSSYLLPFLPLGEDISTLALPEFVNCYEQSDSQWPERHNCPVIWQTDRVDWSTPGRKRVFGVLQTEGTHFRLAEDFDHSKVFCEVLVTAPDMTPETVRDIYIEIAPWVVAQGTPQDSLTPLSQVIPPFCFAFTGELGEYVVCDYTIDYSGVDTTICGTYTAYVTPTLPFGLALPTDFEPQPVKIGVVLPDAVDLSAVVHTGEGTHSTITCEWLYAPQDWKDTVKTEISIGDGPWQEDGYTEDKYAGKIYTHGNILHPGTRFDVGIPNLELHTDYYFRLRYEDGRVSNVLHVRREEEFFYTEGGIGGDRDGSETEGSDFPSLEQPLPTPTFRPKPSPVPPPVSSPAQLPTYASEPPGPTPALTPEPVDEPSVSAPTAALEYEPSPFVPLPPPLPVTAETPPPSPQPPSVSSFTPPMEQVTDTATILSGMRLRELISLSNGTVAFEKQGIMVDLPVLFLQSLDLDDTALFEVRIEQPQAGSFRISLFAEGESLLDLPETLVRIALADGSDLACYDDTGNLIPGSSWDAELGYFSVTVTAAGLYHLLPISVNAAPPSPLSDITPPLPSSANSVTAAASPASSSALLTLVAIAGVAAVFSLWLFRRGRHG